MKKIIEKKTFRTESVELLEKEWNGVNIIITNKFNSNEIDKSTI